MSIMLCAISTAFCVYAFACHPGTFSAIVRCLQTQQLVLKIRVLPSHPLHRSAYDLAYIMSGERLSKPIPLGVSWVELFFTSCVVPMLCCVSSASA